MRAWITLGIVLLFYLLSFVDKQMISLIVDQIGHSLKLQDAQLGLAIGAAFGTFYTAGVILAGWMLDRYSKKLILFAAILGWTVAAMGSGLAQTFTMLFVVRALVGLGESFLPPAALSLIASAFPRSKLTIATGIFYAGANLGSIVALIAGGQLIARLNGVGGLTLPIVGHVAAWRGAFLLSAMPGIPIAFLAFLLWERPAGRQQGIAVANDKAHDLEREKFWAYIGRRKKLVLCHNLAAGLMAASSYAFLLWSPAYLSRNFGWPANRIGLVLAVGSALGAIGNISWGWAVDRLRTAGVRDAHYLFYPAVFLICIPMTAFVFERLGPGTFMVGAAVLALFLLSNGGMTTAMQLGNPPQFQARIIGLQTIASGVFGLALAPTLVPSIAQFAFHDRMAIGQSIVIVVAVSMTLAAGLLLWVRPDLRDAIQEQENRRYAGR